MRVLILVLTLNELENLSVLLSRTFGSCPDADVLVVDDDSPDGTGELATRMAEQNPRLKVVIRKERRRLGNAMCFGLRYAIDRDYEFVVNLNGDLSHSPEDIPRLIATSISSNPPADLVIGSRYVQGSLTTGWPLKRLLISRVVNRFATLVLRLPVSDCSGGFHCYRVARLSELDFSAMISHGYSIQEEILMKLQARGARMIMNVRDRACLRGFTGSLSLAITIVVSFWGARIKAVGDGTLGSCRGL